MPFARKSEIRCLDVAISDQLSCSKDFSMLEPGLTYTSILEVTADKLALSMGSGDLSVLATPAMMALMENAAMLAVAAELPMGSSTVGGHISTSHLRPTALGKRVSATALLTAVDGRKLTFAISAQDEEGNCLGEGTHLRFIVDKEKFLSKL